MCNILTLITKANELLDLASPLLFLFYLIPKNKV